MGVVPGSNTFTNMQGSYFLFENKILKKITSIQYTCFLVKRDIDATHLDLKKNLSAQPQYYIGKPDLKKFNTTFAPKMEVEICF